MRPEGATSYPGWGNETLAQGRAAPSGRRGTLGMRCPFDLPRALQISPTLLGAGWGRFAGRGNVVGAPVTQGVALGWVELPLRGACLVHLKIREAILA